MALLLDTNILVRLSLRTDAFHPIASRAVIELHRRGEVLHITAQNLIEFRNVATRPLTSNGLGLSAADTEAKSAAFESAFPLLPETPDVFTEWKAVVSALGIVGKQVHDARLAAVCRVHGVGQVLTFNVSDFARFATLTPPLIAVDPSTV